MSTDTPPDFQRLPIGEHRLPCPKCDRGTRDRALSVTIKSDGGGVWHCHRCGAAGGWRSGSAMPTKKPDQHLALASNWRAWWRTLSPICGTAKAYLLARDCAIPSADGDLRCTESLQHITGYTGPAMVALVTDAVSGEPITLHRTWIKANGEKADVDPPRMLLGKHRKDGGCVRLWPDAAVTTGLAVAEGIETALTLATAFKPVWSAIDAGNLGKFPVLDGIESLLIAADNDPAGLRAAEQCAQRWYDAGHEVRIAMSPAPGEDLNDLARRAA